MVYDMHRFYVVLGYFAYLCSSPVLIVRACGPRSLATDGGHELWTSLFSFANKNLLPSGAPKEMVRQKRRWVLNICITNNNNQIPL
jgi:hypothetical protein